MGKRKYVATDTAAFQVLEEGKTKKIELLWGDSVEILDDKGSQWRGKARGFEGLIDRKVLGDQPLLEVYFIDVGQGDGVLIRFPEGRHVLIDGGYNRAKQPSGKNAADFVDWKFTKDYGLNHIHLNAMISSHCDADHYGGLWDLLSRDEKTRRELNAGSIKVDAFFHPGVGWWSMGEGSTRSLGSKSQGYLTHLLGDRTSLKKALDEQGELRAQGEWGQFLQCVYNSKCEVARLSHRTGYVPGFSPEDGAGSLKVLAPIEEKLGRKAVLPDLGPDSQNTNGHSVLLRLDYGRTRMLLTGDLNAASQRRILDALKGRRQELACDVVKACHHGSDDVSVDFLSAVNAAATIISSGDNEQHAHPRPGVVAASAMTGYMRVEKDRILTPLIYSTEVARSIRLGRIERIHGDEFQMDKERIASSRVSLDYATVTSGALRPVRGRCRAAEAYVVAGIIYGLVNVRTDGETILCATRNEARHSWDIKKFTSRF